MALKIEQHKRKQQRKAQEKLNREKQERMKNAKEAAKAREDATKTSPSDPSGGGSDNMPDFSKFLKDPELFQAFQDPEVSQVFKDVCDNPANLAKYRSNPKIMSLINKMAAKFGGPGGMPGMPGGMPGFPSGGVNPPPSAPQDDVGLD